jgi:parallel beta-helix repeat protein
MKRRIQSRMVFTSVTLVFLVICSSSVLAKKDTALKLKIPLLSLIPHDPVFIDSNIDFETYGFPGNGTKVNPYVIEEYSFAEEETFGIYVENTDVFFVIRNCYTDSNTYGIYINDVATGTASIINNTCEYSLDSGIVIQDSNKISVINNTCKYSIFAGILILETTDLKLINNTCLFNFWGAGIEASSDTYVFNNELNYNTGYGLVSNVCYGNTLLNNSCTHNPIGAYLSETDICQFIYNRFQRNTEHGLYLNYQSDGNLIHHNDFIKNNLGGYSQAYDDGQNNIFYDSNTNEGNFWSNYIGSGGYLIDGESNSIDLYPLTEEGTIPDILEFSHISLYMLSILISFFFIPFILKNQLLV